MVFGNLHGSNVFPSKLNNEHIEYVLEWKYLGAVVVAGKNLSFSPINDLRNFNASFNSLYTSRTRPSETVMMHLLYTACIPNLTYAADVKSLSA